ncbi:hypothetical protein PXJ20_29010 [Paraburkholderia sp. A1RI_3L]|jgi:hypothetical protein|uniref:hypothetical protein n=1 Tax=Paraburkholderia TaxID=1822464 RepID=UPI00034BF64F|nr:MULTISPECIES: hypothetical protein [Paraburkholderia]WEY40919.1 hypothetical protein P2869_25860 [Paraburkholderia sp. SUR17]
MAPIQPARAFESGADRNEPRAPRNNVIPFPSSRVLLPITLDCANAASTRERLTALLHSALGVYVAHTQAVHDGTRVGVRVHLDISPDDLDFAIHTLIATVPEATIGHVRRRTA